MRLKLRIAIPFGIKPRIMKPRRVQFSRFAAAALILWAGTPRRGIRMARRAIPGRKTACFLSAAIALLAGSWPAAAAENAPPASLRTVARIHWLGMKRLAGETNAAPWMGVWKLPESGKLEHQTLDKLSLAPWPLLHRGTDTNAAALLRPLLDDVVAEESYTEIRRAPDLPDCAKQGCELGQGDRLFRGVNNGFQLRFQAHAAISTFCMVLDGRGRCVHRC